MRRRLTLQQYAELDHLLVAPLRGARGPVDEALAAAGLERRIALRIPDFLLAPHVIAQTDLIVTLAEQVLRRVGEPLGLRVLSPPIEVTGFQYAVMWDERRTTEPGHRWLRDTIRRACV